MVSNILDEINVESNSTSTITVMGVGGAGGNAVTLMKKMGIYDVNFMVCNTDSQVLDGNPIEHKIQLGKEGLGAGNDPNVGRDAAVDSIEIVRQKLEQLNTKMLFVAAGMGGGTGTGATPVIAKMAHDMEILTVAVVTSPLRAEGPTRYNQAMRAIEELATCVDSLLVIDNNSIGKLFGRLSLKQAFSAADEVLRSATKGLAEIITVKSDLVNVDFKDASKVIKNSGRALIGVASAEGEDRVQRAVAMAMESPLLNNNSIAGAKNILLNIMVKDSDMLFYDEVEQILEEVQSKASTINNAMYMAGVEDYQGANIIWGTSEKDTLGDDTLEIVLIATGFPSPEAGSQSKGAVVEDGASEGANQQSVSPLESGAHRVSRGDEHVTLGKPSSKYLNMDAKLRQPAYQTRGVKFANENAASVKSEGAQARAKDEGNSLF